MSLTFGILRERVWCELVFMFLKDLFCWYTCMAAALVMVVWVSYIFSCSDSSVEVGGSCVAGSGERFGMAAWEEPGRRDFAMRRGGRGREERSKSGQCGDAAVMGNGTG